MLEGIELSSEIFQRVEQCGLLVKTEEGSKLLLKVDNTYAVGLVDKITEVTQQLVFLQAALCAGDGIELTATAQRGLLQLLKNIQDDLSSVAGGIN